MSTETNILAMQQEGTLIDDNEDGGTLIDDDEYFDR